MTNLTCQICNKSETRCHCDGLAERQFNVESMIAEIAKTALSRGMSRDAVREIVRNAAVATARNFGLTPQAARDAGVNVWKKILAAVDAAQTES